MYKASLLINTVWNSAKIQIYLYGPIMLTPDDSASSKESEILSVPYPVEFGNVPGYRPVSFYDWYPSHSNEGKVGMET